MLILGLESATAQVGCAIGGHEGVLASSHSARGRRHAENLTPAIEFVCRQARVELKDISCVAVDHGLTTVLRETCKFYRVEVDALLDYDRNPTRAYDALTQLLDAAIADVDALEL